MIIGFEGKRAVCNATGLGNYSRLLIDELSHYFPQHQYYIYSPKPDTQHRLEPFLQRENVSLHLPTHHPLGKRLWRSVRGLSAQAEQDGVDLLHGLSAQLPLDLPKHSLKSVVTVHDLIFCHFPQFYGAINTNIYKYKSSRACKIADRIIAVSECTKRDIIHFLGIPGDKIDVIYQGCDPLFSQPVDSDEVQEVQRTYSLPQRYLLNVGTIEERKNILLAVKALERIDDKDIPLIIVGKKTKYASLVEEYTREHGIINRVRCLSGVSTRHLKVLYHLATAFIYPSRYEGFGIPIIEAQTCGVPVIIATGSCLEEAAGVDAISVDPDSTDDMVSSINTILKDESLRYSLIEKGKENIKRFELQKLAQETITTYQKVLDSI